VVACEEMEKERRQEGKERRQGKGAEGGKDEAHGGGLKDYQRRGHHSRAQAARQEGEEGGREGGRGMMDAYLGTMRFHRRLDRSPQRRETFHPCNACMLVPVCGVGVVVLTTVAKK